MLPSESEGRTSVSEVRRDTLRVGSDAGFGIDGWPNGELRWGQTRDSGLTACYSNVNAGFAGVSDGLNQGQ